MIWRNYEKNNDLYLEDTVEEIKYLTYCDLNKLRNGNSVIEFNIGNLFYRIP